MIVTVARATWAGSSSSQNQNGRWDASRCECEAIPVRCGKNEESPWPAVAAVSHTSVASSPNRNRRISSAVCGCSKSGYYRNARGCGERPGDRGRRQRWLSRGSRDERHRPISMPCDAIRRRFRCRLATPRLASGSVEIRMNSFAWPADSTGTRAATGRRDHSNERRPLNGAARRW